jgi:hypothetical protein
MTLTPTTNHHYGNMQLQRSKNTRLRRVFFSETHGKGCMTDICPVKDLCRAFFVARTAMNLCRASGTAHDEKRSLTARPYETASDGFARTLSCAWTHDKQN